jgi:hypothetical protein
MTENFKRNFGFWLSRKINTPLVCPDTLQLSMTNRCNLRCKMCSVWSNYQPENELTLEEMKDVIDQAAAWGIREINLCGGEPLLNPHCFSVIEHAKAKKMRVILTTNGTVINESVAKQLLETKLDIICVSLDGATAAVHDRLRGLEGAYEKIIRGIQFLNDNEEAVGHKPIKVLIMTLHNDNLDEVLDYVSLAKRMRIDSLYITSLVLDNVKLYSHAIESPLWIKGERLKKLDQTIDKLISLQQSHYGFSYPSFHLIKRYFRGELKKSDWVCFAGFRRFVVCSDGNIQMCGEIIGSIRNVKDMREIWNTRVARQKRKKIKQCRNFCLQDCHARQESASLKSVVAAYGKK